MGREHKLRRKACAHTLLIRDVVSMENRLLNANTKKNVLQHKIGSLVIFQSVYEIWHLHTLNSALYFSFMLLSHTIIYGITSKM